VPRGQPVQIAFADDLTGSASGFGTSLANGVQMAVEAHPAIRGFPIHVNLVDAPCGDPAADAAAATSIVANAQNVGVLGQLCSSGFDQALPLYQAADLVTITGSATDPALPSFAPTVFNRTAVNDTCCPFVDEFDPWYATVVTLPGDFAWQQAYSLEFGTAPTAFADLYYDAAGLLIRNLQKVASFDSSGNLVVDRAAIAQAVRSTTKYQGVSCRITLDPATGNRLNDPTALSRCATETD
jgi:ABC-type branched-subunit amino acid transport system substrate-binding protein